MRTGTRRMKNFDDANNPENYGKTRGHQLDHPETIGG
jgi:hypothetical protein